MRFFGVVFSLFALCCGGGFGGGAFAPVAAAQSLDLARVRGQAEKGFVMAQMLLGSMYKEGEAGAAQNDGEALKWFLLAAKSGFYPAQYIVAVMYANGQGAPASAAEAAKWHKRAAAGGLAPAQFALGQMYAAGEGVEQDAAAALRWLKLAAAQGHAAAKSRLKELQGNGGVGAQNAQRAQPAETR